MRRFHEQNPVVILLYYLAVTVVTMFSMNPVILCLSLVSSVATCCLYADTGIRWHLFSLVLFLILAVINPLVVHNGVTVLFYFNSNPITLEATLYGVGAAAMIVATLYRLRALTHDLDSEKVLYLFGRFSPKLSLLLSMALRYISLLRYRYRQIRDSQRALGLYRDGNLIDEVRGRLRILSILMTWSLENGIVTAQSMDARGYGSRRRTAYALYHFRLSDLLLLLLILGCTGITVAGLCVSPFDYYPLLQGELFTPLSVAGWIAYAILGVLPIIIHIKEAIRWRILQSGI